MALTPEEQRLFDWAKSQLPHWFTHGEREEEYLAAAAKQHGIALRLAQNWMGQTLILEAVGPIGGDADWLNMHAGERGTSRQAGESTPALRQRIRAVEDAVTRPVLLQAAQAIVDEDGIVGAVAIVELKRDQAYFGQSLADSAPDGGTFADEGGGVFSFTPNTPFFRPVLGYPQSTNYAYPKLSIFGATDFDNNGEFQVLGLSDDAVLYANAIGVAGSTATSWEIRHFDILDNPRDGFHRAFLDRGYRMHGDPRHTILMILPFGCTEGTRLSVLDMLRTKKGAGVKALVECRASP